MYIPPYRDDTNIPRQVGLAGSSAICTACFKALLAFYSLTESEFQKPICPKFVLSVEHDELGINAGLQDRVIQVRGWADGWVGGAYGEAGERAAAARVGGRRGPCR